MYVCTECSTRYKTEAKAAKCHWGIGGVQSEEEWIAYLAELTTAGIDVSMWA
jgi:hypothetical protein